MEAVLDYTSPGPLTGVDAADSRALIEQLAAKPSDICRVVRDLVIQPSDAQALNLPEDRFGENHIRPASVLLQRLISLDPAPLTAGREPDKRVIGTCRHFAVMSCAFLRYRGIAARVRCGFATYFQPGKGVDHWITEYRDDNDGRWIRIDSEILGHNVLPHAHDLRLETSSVVARRGTRSGEARSTPLSSACTEPRTGGLPRSVATP